MEVEEIINKTELSQEEMQYVVEQYIWEKKQKKVTINIHNNKMLQFVPKVFADGILQDELIKLNDAYNDACEYFFEKFRNSKEETS